MSAIVSSPATPSQQPAEIAAKAHHNKHGKGFINPWPSYQEQSGPQIMGKILKMRVTGQWKDPDTTPPTVPIVKPHFLPTRQTEKLRATWLGHACYYVEFPGGLRVLFDPVFTERCSPFTKHMGLDDTHVTEMDWWEEKQITLSPSSQPGSTDQIQQDISATIGCLPCQHTSARTAFDKAHTLWASWSITSGDRKIWFGGDTGYRTVPSLPAEEFDYGEKYSDLPHCPAFAQIGELRGPFDLGLIPIGAYDPRSIMSPMHANPYDSVNIFVDTKCKKALGIHWGTWVLTSEEVMEPPKVLKKALKWKGVEKDRFETCDIGESREID
ncbi:hypothetical protein LTR56_023852 [Elasticomyces elasticus]|nr:hypothetical protein LTR56_023852 [Elasticomyces elasticus]KAK3666850.1 hypothetical protein LTR22_002437 [Elasticomyces elasticus]KAK4907773.1 hypothetical protein LTR49_023237 [Elasticomyces elasticus]KAK5746984.1 hypothetical protein LTS12_022553 [Elasticomyces elasticus]